MTNGQDSNLKETAARHLEEIRRDALALSHRIHAHPSIGLDCGTAVNHQPEFAAWCAKPTGDQAVLDGALAMAWTVIDIATSQEQRQRLLSRDRS
jgi:hypothetical protein